MNASANRNPSAAITTRLVTRRALIRQITREYANLALTELAATVCELLDWRRPNGGLKTRECYLFVRELHKRGWLPWLPAPQPRVRRPEGVKKVAEPGAPPVVLSGAVVMSKSRFPLADIHAFN
jgi:hypothetical protein